MKYFYYFSLFSVLFFSLFITYGFFGQTETARVSMQKDSAPETQKIERFLNSYQELSWIGEDTLKEQRYSIYKRLAFLEAIISGEYLEYLNLFMKIPERKRLSYEDFLDLHRRLEEFIDLSVFSRKELLDVLSFGLILGEIEESEEFKKRAWVYETESLARVILLHDSVLPSMKRFAKDRKKFLCLILEGLQFEGLLGEYRNNIAYNISDDISILKENKEYFDISFLMFICRLAGKYSDGGADTPSFSSGFYSYIMDFKEDLITHLQHAS